MWKYLKKYRLYAIIAPLFMIGEVSMDLIQPTLMNKIVDEGVLGLSNGGNGDLKIILMTGLKMIITVALGGTFGVLCGVFTNMCSQNFSNDIRKDCFSKIMSFSLEQTDKFSTGSLVTRVTNDVTQVQNMVSMVIRGFVRNGMFLVGGTYCMLKLNISFGITTLCALPLLIVLVIVFIAKSNPMFSLLQTKLDKVNSVMQENVAGARVVKAYVKEDYEKIRFSKANNSLIDTQLKVLLLFSYIGPIMNVIMNITVVAIIYIGGIKIQSGSSLTPGNVMAAITYVSQILGGVMMIAAMFQNISRGMASSKRLNEVLNCEPNIKDGLFDNKTDEKGTVKFENVSFAYPNGNGETVLDNISFTINKGETIGILGSTGCGKSSLISLIPRFYDATQGNIYVDGVNVKDYDLKTLRDKIAVSLQKSELFSDTIKGNISWGKDNSSEAEIRFAAEIAQADDFITEKENEYDTIVAEKGASLSGGQKQRISIARAVLKNAEIMIFDDSTSALDLKTEAELYKALNKNFGDVTKIIIAQRIASVKNADRIIVLDGGKIVAFDNHENLMDTCDIYKDIYSSQLKND